MTSVVNVDSILFVTHSFLDSSPGSYTCSIPLSLSDICSVVWYPCSLYHELVRGVPSHHLLLIVSLKNVRPKKHTILFFLVLCHNRPWLRRHNTKNWHNASPPILLRRNPHQVFHKEHGSSFDVQWVWSTTTTTTTTTTTRMMSCGKVSSTTYWQWCVEVLWPDGHWTRDRWMEKRARAILFCTLCRLLGTLGPFYPWPTYVRHTGEKNRTSARSAELLQKFLSCNKQKRNTDSGYCHSPILF